MRAHFFARDPVNQPIPNQNIVKSAPVSAVKPARSTPPRTAAERAPSKPRNLEGEGDGLFRGRSAQNFRDPGFLGIVNPENDTVYLPLKKGNNELVLAVSELGGGWGFICRLADVGN